MLCWGEAGTFLGAAGGGKPLHCPQHTSCSCVPRQKCSGSAICGDFLCLPTGSPSSLLCIRSATRANLSLTSSRVSRTTLSTCEGLCLHSTALRCAESSCPHQPDLLPQPWRESRSPGSLCRLLEEQRFPDTALDTGPGTEVPADLFLSSKGSFNCCCCLRSALSRAEHLPPSTSSVDSAVGRTLPGHP